MGTIVCCSNFGFRSAPASAKGIRILLEFDPRFFNSLIGLRFQAMDVEELRSKLERHGQDHLLAFYEQLDDDAKEEFRKQLSALDLAQVKRSFESSNKDAAKSGEKDERLKQIPVSRLGSVAAASPEELNSWRVAGLHAVAENKVAALLLAGGQGTRLNFPHPKGMYSVGLPSKKTLYQIQAERILKVQQLAEEHCGKAGTVTWYIMTSEHTQESTQEFFDKHNYFGLKKENIVLFKQNTFPCLTMEGKIILSAPGKIARSPVGNGGLFRALEDRGILKDMEERGIENVHVHGVDNILVKVADPVFIGYCLSKKADCATKVIKKQQPTEKIGVISFLDDKFQVVDCSEISPETEAQKKDNGDLVLNAGNIVNHFFTVNFLKNVVSKHELELRTHIAKKKIPYVDENGKCIKPTEGNGIKLEKFVFDVFQFSEQFAVLQVKREEEFSPLKNASGAPKETPETARNALFDLHYRYIVNAGGKFVGDQGEDLPNIPGTSQVQCEISPLLSYAGEGLSGHVNGRKFPSSELLHLKADSEDGVANENSNH